MNKIMSQSAPQCAKAGWNAKLNLDFIGTGHRTFVRRTHSGPLRIQRPFYPEGEVCHVYVLHPPGGIVSGDTLRIDVSVEESAAALVTTPGAAKFYRSSGTPGMQIQILTVANGSLEWFPQETIFFAGCQAQLQTTISMVNGARFIGWDIQCYGRPAANESFSSGSATSLIKVLVDNVPVLIERSVINNAHSVQRRTGMRGNATQGLFIATVAEPWLLTAIRELPSLTGEFFATHIDGLLVVRYLGQCAEKAKSVFIRIWTLLRPVVIGKPACAPRIWAT